MIKAIFGFDDTGKGLSWSQPRQAAGFDDNVKTRNVTLARF